MGDFSDAIKYAHELDGGVTADYIPLMEGKIFSQYNHGHATYVGDEVFLCYDFDENIDQDFYRYINKDIAHRKNPLLRTSGYFLVARDIIYSTNEQIIISAIIPATITNYTVRVLEGEISSRNKCVLLSSSNSPIVDFIIRMRIEGNHLSNCIIYQLPILASDSFKREHLNFIVPRVLELTYISYDLKPFAEDLGYHGEPSKIDPVRRHQLKSELDAYYAKLYGLTRDELRYILAPADVMGEDYPSETFRVLKNKEIKEFGECRTQRLVLEERDKLEKDVL